MGVDLKSVVTIGPPKEAALYFEKVLPFDKGDSFFQSSLGDEADLHVPFKDGDFDEDVLRSLLGSDRNNPAFNDLRFVAIAFHLGVRLKNKEFRDTFREKSYISEVYDLIGAKFEIDFDEVARTIDAGRTPESGYLNLLSAGFAENVARLKFSEAAFWQTDPADSDLTAAPTVEGNQLFQASLSGLKLVDPRKVSWDQLIEFRKDEESFSALRDLRIFFQTEYTDKDINFISDDLGARIEKYEKSRKLWGLETAIKSLSVIFEDRTVLASSVGVMAANAMGASLLAASGAGAAVALGGVMLKLGQVAIEQKREQISSPVRYLTDLKKLSPR